MSTARRLCFALTMQPDGGKTDYSSPKSFECDDFLPVPQNMSQSGATRYSHDPKIRPGGHDARTVFMLPCDKRFTSRSGPVSVARLLFAELVTRRCRLSKIAAIANALSRQHGKADLS